MASLLDNILSFGATPSSYLGDIVSQQDLEKLRGKAASTGAFNALIGYLATPKNQRLGLGTVIGNTLLAGQQGAQGVYDQAVLDYQTKAKIDEMRRAKEMQAKRDAFLANIGQPNATRQVAVQETVQEPVPPQEGAVAPNFQTQMPAPQVTQEQYYDPNVMMQQALQTGAIDLKDYITLTQKQKQGTRILSSKDIENMKTQGIDLPTGRGQKYQQDVVTGKIDLIEGTLAPEKADFRVGDTQTIDGYGDPNTKITREYQGNGQWRIIGKTSVRQGTGEEVVDYLTPQAQLGLAKIYMQTGVMPPLGSGKNATLARSNIYNMVFQLQQGKMTDDQIVQSIIGNKQNRAAEQQTLKSFSGGIEGRAVNAMNTATDHLFTLEEAGMALKNGDIRAFNAIKNKIAKELGVAPPVSFEGVKKLVSGEIVKAATGSAGALGDRDDVQKTIDAANSPEQLLGQIARYKELMAGKLNSLELQFISGTNRGSSEFRRRLTQRTQSLLPPAADTNEASPTQLNVAPTPTVPTKLPPTSPNPNESGWVLQFDKSSGVKAYVNPKNPKQYRIVSE